MQRSRSPFMVLASLAIAASALAKGKPAPMSCPSDVVAAVADACPCAGKTLPDSSVQPWRNHGKYVSCVVHFRNALRKSGCFTDDSVRRTLARCAARSTCGKSHVLCCHYTVGTCTDQTPGDAVKGGTCSNAATLACDVAGDCTTSAARITRDADACTSDGGVVVEGGGSVCSTCPTTTTTTTTTLP